MHRTCWLTWLLAAVVVVSSSKLNVPRVLLPISPKTPVTYTLEVSDGGCYTWSSSRPEAVKVIPLPVDNDESCSRRAVVTATGSSSHKTSAIVLAQEQISGEILRCDVIVNQIHTLQIAMKTRELFIEDAPEEFYARASDDQGNEFSSVDGLVFRWTFEGHSTDAESSNEPVLRWVKFADSSYDVIPSIAALESQGQQGHVVLIEGLRTGSARVSVQLDNESFKKVPSVTVNIVVVANLVLDPPELYLMPGTVTELKLSQIRQGRAESIPFPSTQYYLEIDDPKVGSIIEASGSIKALERGTTNVRLRDRNMKDPDTSHAPYVTVHVVHPHRMGLALLPDRMWAIVSHVNHAIQVEFFDEENNLIQPIDDLALRVQVPQAFRVESSTTNQTYHFGQGVEVGMFKIKATLRTLKLADGTDLDLSPPLKAMADLEIFQGVTVTPKRQVLIWDPIMQPRYKIKYGAAGGADSFQFGSTNTSLATIAQTGVAQIHGLGTAKITASIPKYPHIRGESELFVLPALTMQIVPHIVEIDEGDKLYVPVIMSTRLPSGEEVVFDDCRQVRVQIELSDRKNFVTPADMLNSPKIRGCTTVEVAAKGISVTKLSLTLDVDGVHIKDSVMLASYRRLRSLEPLSGETVLALGSSRLVVFEGGPLPWVNKPSGHYRKVLVEDAAIATIGELEPILSNKFPHKDAYQVTVTCRSIGETNVIYQIGNIASSTNTNPIQTLTGVKIYCVHPNRISLTAEVRMPDNSKIPCDMDSTTQRLAAQSYLDLNLVAIVKDESGRKLDNFSSLAIDWTLSKPDLAQLSSPNSILLETKDAGGYQTIARSYQLLKPSGRTGPLDVTAKITGYKPEVLKLLGLDSQPALVKPKANSVTEDEDGDEDDSLTDTVDLILVDDVSVDPGKDSLFNHPNNKLVLRLSQGSGNFHVDYQPQDVARVVYNSNEKTLTVIPLANGELRIVVTDLCLWSRSPAVADISVVGLSRIELEVSDKIEQGSSVPMKVHMFDSLGHTLDATVLPFVNLQPILGSSIVRIKAMDEIEHMVEGVALGETTITYAAGDIRSSIVNVQVFAPLKLSPRNVTLVIGATLQVVSSGGPQPDAMVEYSLDNGPVATCTPNGMVSGIKLGHSKLLARAIGTDRQTGKSRVYSQDQVDVYIVSLSGIRITLPLKRVRQNSEIPVYLMGMDAHQTPFSFGTCIPRLNFEWSLSDSQSGQLMSAFHRSGLDPSPSSSHFSIRFKALQPGHTLLRVRVTAIEPNSGQLSKGIKELVDEVSIQVYESLQLTSPFASNEDVLVMMPNTILNVRTNLDSSATVNYVAGSAIVELDGKGGIASGSLLGQTSLMITAKNNYGVTQTIGSLIEVRSVSYMMLTATPILNVPTTGRLSVVPRGFDFDLRLSYHDTLGRSFHAIRSQLAFRPSRLDLIRISVDLDNCSVTLHADKVGQTVLHFYDEAHPGLVDYLRVDVAEVVRPSQSDLVIGDVVCFSTPILPLAGSTGRWSADSKLLHIDAESGVAIAVAAGSSEVSYSISPQHTTSTGVSIGSLTFLEFHAEGADKFVTNHGRSASHVFPLTLHTNRGGSLIGENCSADSVSRFVRQRTVPFTCRISFSTDQEIKVEEVFTVQAEFDVQTGFYRCAVSAVAAPTALSSLIDANLVVTAYYTSEVAARTSAPFHPGVFIQTPELHVSDLQSTTQLVIVGKAVVLQHLEFSTNDDSALTLYSAQQQPPSSIRIPVRLNTGYFNGQTALHVNVYCPLSGQRVQIPVHVKLFGDEMQCAAREATWLGVLTSLLHFSQEWALSLLSLLGTAAAIYIGYRALFGPGYRTTSDPVVFLPPNARTAEPAFSSPFVKRGPQLWSVDSHDSPVFHQSFHQRSPTNVSPSMRQQQHQSPF